ARSRSHLKVVDSDLAGFQTSLFSLRMLSAADLTQILLRGCTRAAGCHLASVANCHSDRGYALASSSQITLDCECPLPLSDDNEESLQLGVSGEIPSLFRRRQFGQRLVSEQNPDV